MLLKVVALCGCQTRLAAAHVAREVADADHDLAFEVVG